MCIPYRLAATSFFAFSLLAIAQGLANTRVPTKSFYGQRNLTIAMSLGIYYERYGASMVLFYHAVCRMFCSEAKYNHSQALGLSCKPKSKLAHLMRCDSFPAYLLPYLLSVRTKVGATKEIRKVGRRGIP